MGEIKYRSTVDWDVEKMPALKGTVEGIEQLPEKAGGRRVLILDSPDARVRIYESFDLKPVFDSAVAGDTLEIAFMRTKPIKGGKTLKQYNVKLYRA